MSDPFADLADCRRLADALIAENARLREANRERSRRLLDLAGQYAHRIELNPASVGIWLAMDAIKDLP